MHGRFESEESRLRRRRRHGRKQRKQDARACARGRIEISNRQWHQRRDLLTESARGNHHGWPPRRCRYVVRCGRRCLDDIERVSGSGICGGIHEGSSGGGRLRKDVGPNAAGFCVPLRCHSNGGRPAGRSGRGIPASSARESGQHGARPRFLLSMGNKSIR